MVHLCLQNLTRNITKLSWKLFFQQLLLRKKKKINWKVFFYNFFRLTLEYKAWLRNKKAIYLFIYFLFYRPPTPKKGLRMKWVPKDQLSLTLVYEAVGMTSKVAVYGKFTIFTRLKIAGAGGSMAHYRKITTKNPNCWRHWCQNDPEWLGR